MASVVLTPDPILTQKSKAVLKIDKKVLELIEELKKTLQQAKKPKGVGLAAPQIGKPWQIFITRPTLTSPIQVFINPKITWLSKELSDGVPKKEKKLEGCLSIPEVWGKVKRAKALRLRFLTPDGRSQEQTFSGLMATIIQHEMDHLEGKLFTSRVLEQKGKLYKSEKDKEEKEILEEIKLT